MQIWHNSRSPVGLFHSPPLAFRPILNCFSCCWFWCCVLPAPAANRSACAASSKPRAPCNRSLCRGCTSRKGKIGNVRVFASISDSVVHCQTRGELMQKETVQQLEQRAAELKAGLATVGNMRPGSLVERYRRCGKPGCRCAQPGDPGHGPSWSLTHSVSGKTETKIIPQDAVEETQEQIATYKRFRDQVHALVEASEKLCDARLRGSRATSEEEAEKKGFRRAFKARSGRKSKRS